MENVARVQAFFGTGPKATFLFDQLEFFGDPELIILYLLPLSYILNRGMPIRVAIVAGFGGIVCTILSIILQADRPYWLNQSQLAAPDDHTMDNIHRFDTKCEITYGNPSLHMLMASATGALVLLTMRRGSFYEKSSNVEVVFRIVYSGLVILVFLSRLYFATNFISGLVTGTIFGLFGGTIVYFMPWEKAHSGQYLVLAGFSLAWFHMVLWILRSLGVEPYLSHQLAHNYCPKQTSSLMMAHSSSGPNFLTAEKTTSTKHVWTGMAVLAGVALAVFPSVLFREIHKSKKWPNLLPRVLVGVIALLVNMLVYHGLIYYFGGASSLLVNCVISFVTVSNSLFIVPHVIHLFGYL